MKNLTAIILTVITFGVYAQQTHVSVKANELERDYRILFSSPEEQDVTISLYNSNNEVVMSEEETAKQLFKLYHLDKFSNGLYEWRVKYGDETFVQEFEIKSEKKLMKESISVALNDFALNINVKEYNRSPMNIFLFDGSGEQLEYVFWEPNRENREKLLDLTKYDAYEVKLEIVQLGDQAFVETYPLY